MSAKRLSGVIVAVACLVQAAHADVLRDGVREGNRLYAEGQYAQAIDQYDKAVTADRKALEPMFNKANAFYQVDDLAKAIDLYKEVAAQAKDMSLVAKAKYNLGDAHFKQGLKQRDSDLQKAVEELRTGIGYWRSVLDLNPRNENAAKNIEVARLIIKDILDQINKQKDPNQPSDPNQGQQQQDRQDPNQPSQDPNKPSQGQQDPNKPQQSASQDPNQAKDPNQAQPKDPNEQQKKAQEQKAAPDMTAQQILDKEQQDKKQRQEIQRIGTAPVDKDW